MSLSYISHRRAGLSFAVLALALPCMTGCLVLDGGSPADTPVIVNNLKIKVRSGQHAVVGASIQLYEADLTSYTGTSAARLPNPVVTGKDGNYVASTVLICNPKSFFYLVATGGDAGGGDNPAAVLMTAVGSCDELATKAIVLNEATTVASAYALSGFMTSISSVSANATVGTNSGTALALTGITNSFSLVKNLVDVHTGAIPVTTAAGNGTVPQAKMSSLANLLAACIESKAGSAACTGLMTQAPSLTGTLPANTVQAILNIAHNPGANVAAIYALAGTGPFTPALTTAPNDLTLSLLYKGSGTVGYKALATDGSGSISLAGSDQSNSADPGSVVQLNPLGQILTTVSGASTGIFRPTALAIDPANNVWVANCGTTASLTKIGAGGSPILNVPQAVGYGCSTALASDGAGNVYSGLGMGFASHTHYVQQYSPSGAAATGNFPLALGYYPPSSLALDGAGHIALASQVGELFLFNSAGVVTESGSDVESYVTLFYGGAFDQAGSFFWTGEQNFAREGVHQGLLLKLPTGPISSSPFTQYRWESAVGGLALPRAVVVDGAGTEWVANVSASSTQFSTFYPSNVSAFTSAKTVLSPQGGFQSNLNCGSLGVAVDISGNVWSADMCGPVIAEIVGAATPVTPLSVGVRDNTVGQRP